MSSQKCSVKLPPVNYRAKNTVVIFQDNCNSFCIDLLFTRCLWCNLRRRKCIVLLNKPTSIFLLKLSIPHNSLIHFLPSFAWCLSVKKISCSFLIPTPLISYCTYCPLFFCPPAPGLSVLYVFFVECIWIFFL